MHITIMKIKNRKKYLISLLNLKKLFYRKYNYMSKIFPKIYLEFDLKCFHFIVFMVLLLYCHQINE